jgi:hypothetical protein
MGLVFFYLHVKFISKSLPFTVKLGYITNMFSKPFLFVTAVFSFESFHLGLEITTFPLLYYSYA